MNTVCRQSAEVRSHTRVLDDYVVICTDKVRMDIKVVNKFADITTESHGIPLNSPGEKTSVQRWHQTSVRKRYTVYQCE